MNRIFKRHIESHFGRASRLRDFILGWQDGLVNVLGVVLAVATATESFSVVIIAAFAAAFAETISMAAVAYTSFKTERQYYQSEVEREKQEIKEAPHIERKEVEDIYRSLGFRGPMLQRIVRHITSDPRRWLKVMMEQELRLFPARVSPINVAAVVGISAMVGSLIPIVPFFIFSVKTAMIASLVASTIVLFFVGVYKAKTTVGEPVKSGLELAAIGILAAIIGYAIGAVLGAVVVG